MKTPNLSDTRPGAETAGWHFNLAECRAKAEAMSDAGLLTAYRAHDKIPNASHAHVFRRELESRGLNR